MRITALLDFEFTNVILAQFAYNLLQWLILQLPGIGVSKGKQEFLDLFHAIERVEARLTLLVGELRLSAQMRELWDSKHFQFNLALRSSFNINQIYQGVLYKEGLSKAMLDIATIVRIKEFLKPKKDQFKAYWEKKQIEVKKSQNVFSQCVKRPFKLINYYDYDYNQLPPKFFWFDLI